jgi:hypothetical protein
MVGWSDGSRTYAPLATTLLKGCGEAWDSERTAELRESNAVPEKGQETTLCALAPVASCCLLNVFPIPDRHPHNLPF